MDSGSMAPVLFSSMPGLPPIQRLSYEVVACSSYSGTFTPENILDDKPTDLSSRWSGLSSSRIEAQRQADTPWILLKLSGPSLLTSVQFGKFHESHPCNPQSARILAGLEPSAMVEVGRSPLRNDSRAEEVVVRCQKKVWTGDMSSGDAWGKDEEGVARRAEQELRFAVQYVKILPGNAYEPRFNTSIWHIVLHGIPPCPETESINFDFQKAQRLLTNRLTLKHLRRHRMIPAFDALLAAVTSMDESPPHVLEHPLITSLYETLVEDGDLEAAETRLAEIFEAGLMEPYVMKQKASYRWVDVEEDVQGSRPSRRGGHGMCLTPEDGRTYFFGGFDGARDLDDFWVREPLTSDRDSADDMATDCGVWTRIERESEGVAWPPATSGHSMTTDGKKLYMMGAHLPMIRRVGNSGSPSTPTASTPSTSKPSPASYGLIAADVSEVVEIAKAALTREAKAHVLWAFDLEKRAWEVVSDGREIPFEGKDALQVRQIFYANESGKESILAYGHLLDDLDEAGGAVYSLDLESLRWSRLDSVKPLMPQVSVCTFAHQANHLIIVKALSKTAPTLPAVLQWSLASRSFVRTSEGRRAARSTGPTGGPYRSYLDMKREELIVLFGHERGCILPQDGKVGTVWRYLLRSQEWLPVENQTLLLPGSQDNFKADVDEELHRIQGRRTPLSDDFEMQLCGHQVVYDPVREECLLVGGRTSEDAPGDNTFKRLEITRFDSLEVKRRCIQSIRRQRFLEMISHRPLQESLGFLQTSLRSVYKDSDEEESRDLRQLSSFLLRSGFSLQSKASLEHPDKLHAKRLGVFQEIMRFVDERYREPTQDLEHLAMSI